MEYLHPESAAEAVKNLTRRDIGELPGRFTPQRVLSMMRIAKLAPEQEVEERKRLVISRQGRKIT